MLSISKLKRSKSGWLVYTTVVLAKDILTIEEIFETVCKELNVDGARLKENTKTRDNSDARRVFVFYSRMLTTASLTKIGLLINRHFTAVRESNKTACELLEVHDEKVTIKMNKVSKALKKLQREKV